MNAAQHPLSEKEKLSLRSMLKIPANLREGSGEPKQAANSIVPSSSENKFSKHEATELVDSLLLRLSYRSSAEARDELIQRLQRIPKQIGDSWDVIAANHKVLLLPEDHLDLTQESQAATKAIRQLISMATAISTEPSLLPWCEITTFASAKEQLESIPAKNQTDSERDYLRFLNQVENSGLLRRQQALPPPADLLELIQRFPNFEAPLRFLAEQCAYAMLSTSRKFAANPILLVGPAGIGKTHFATALADILGTRSEVISMASQTCGFSLSGMDRGWSSARPGLVFNALLHGNTLSPLIVLDEIDKANQDARSDPLGPLYSLLEPRTSGAYRDEYAGFPIDASKFFWLATANDVRNIPAPLLSRFKVFQIEEPSLAQIEAIAKQVFSEVTANMPGPLTLPDSWYKKLAGKSVRQIRTNLQEALGKVALRAVLKGEMCCNISEQDLTSQHEYDSRRIGFF